MEEDVEVTLHAPLSPAESVSSEDGSPVVDEDLTKVRGNVVRSMEWDATAEDLLERGGDE